MPQLGDNNWNHIDDVGTKTFLQYARSTDEPYVLQRASDLLPGAQRVRVGDTLTMIDAEARGQPQQLFDIMAVVPLATPGHFQVQLLPGAQPV